ncbi:MAG: hypothetical protein ACREBH_03945 [Candidatus Micrarchaeaceae archaeon]
MAYRNMESSSSEGNGTEARGRSRVNAGMFLRTVPERLRAKTRSAINQYRVMRSEIQEQRAYVHEYEGDHNGSVNLYLKAYKNIYSLGDRQRENMLLLRASMEMHAHGDELVGRAGLWGNCQDRTDMLIDAYIKYSHAIILKGRIDRTAYRAVQLRLLQSCDDAIYEASVSYIDYSNNGKYCDPPPKLVVARKSLEVLRKNFGV